MFRLLPFFCVTFERYDYGQYGILLVARHIKHDFNRSLINPKRPSGNKCFYPSFDSSFNCILQRPINKIRY